MARMRAGAVSPPADADGPRQRAGGDAIRAVRRVQPPRRTQDGRAQAAGPAPGASRDRHAPG
jgi:hypothetical protein